MAMYYYASKISAIACGTRCKQTVIRKSRGQRDRDKYDGHSSSTPTSLSPSPPQNRSTSGFDDIENDATDIISVANVTNSINMPATIAGLIDADAIAESSSLSIADGVRYRRRYSQQLDAYDIEMGFQKYEVVSTTGKSLKTTSHTGTTGISGRNGNAKFNDDDDQTAQYDVPKNTHKRSYCDENYESSVLGSGGIMYTNGRIVSGPLESLLDILIPKNLIDFDKEFVFSFLLSSRLFLRPHELLRKLLSSVPDNESCESLVALLAEWTHRFPYDYRDERMMNHVKHIVARCSNTHLETIVSDILSALLKRLTDLEKHEEELRACQLSNEIEGNNLNNATASQYAQILCRLEKKLAKHIGPEEFIQCSSNILLDKQKKWDQPSTSGGPPGVQDPKKTCNLETYLDWSARLRLFVCNQILQCSGIHDRSKTVELWSGVAQYCLLVGNYNSATAILESLESPPIARLKITWSKLQVTCQQLDCMQRHAEGHGDLWQKQAIVLNENYQKTDITTAVALLTATSISTTTATTMATTHVPPSTLLSTPRLSCATTTGTTTHLTPNISTTIRMPTIINPQSSIPLSMSLAGGTTVVATISTPSTMQSSDSTTLLPVTLATTTTTTSLPAPSSSSALSQSSSLLCADMLLVNAVDNISLATTSDLNEGMGEQSSTTAAYISVDGSNSSYSSSGLGVSTSGSITNAATNKHSNNANLSTPRTIMAEVTAIAPATASSSMKSVTTLQQKPNDWVVIPVFADIVKLALAVREDCLQRLPNGHIDIGAFDRLAAIVGAFTKHMQAVKSTTEAPSGEYELFCHHMQKASKLNESELMMASFDCEEPNNAEKLMYDLN